MSGPCDNIFLRTGGFVLFGVFLAHLHALIKREATQPLHTSIYNVHLSLSKMRLDLLGLQLINLKELATAACIALQ